MTIEDPPSGQPKPWRVAGVSVKGVSHVRNGQPCQDAHCWRLLSGETLVVAVADGAGSAPQADVGSAVAAAAAVEWIAHRESIIAGLQDKEQWQKFLIEAVEAARDAVDAEAASRSLPARNLATTLILVVATPAVTAAAQVGDGAAIVADADGNLTSLTLPPPTENVNETTFLNTPGASVEVTYWPGQARHLAAISDGLQMLALKMPDGTPHRAFFLPLFQCLSSAESEAVAERAYTGFLDSDRVKNRTEDDLTLFIANWAS